MSDAEGEPAYLVHISEGAEAEVDALFQWLFQLNPVAADHFRDALSEATGSLKAMPRRCPVAPENDLYDREVRLLLFKSGRTIYRLLFTIFEAEEADEGEPGAVYVLHVRHGAAQPLGTRPLPSTDEP
jgi:plasmid stabilization system protein ParE